MPRRKSRNNNFTKRVRIALVERGWSMSDLAREVSRPRSTVSRVVHGTQFRIVREQIETTLFLSTE